MQARGLHHHRLPLQVGCSLWVAGGACWLLRTQDPVIVEGVQVLA